MLRLLASFYGYGVKATDGEIGTVHEFLFEDNTWAVKYVVVKTGSWLTGRKVLISPGLIGRPEWSLKTIPVSLAMKQVENSPDIDTDKPVSQWRLDLLHEYYGWPFLHVGEGFGPLPLAPSPAALAEMEKVIASEKERSDPHLQSSRNVAGYHIQTSDDQVGHLEDFILDDQHWQIRYIVLDTKNWLPGRQILISPSWIKATSWDQRKVHVDLTSESLENSPAYDPRVPVNREYEVRLYDYYGRPIDRIAFSER
jgi:hypothetical protein